MKSKNEETAVLTLLGFIKTKIAKLSGFHKPEDIQLSNWKIIPQLWWLKIQIAVGNVQTFLVGSHSDEILCGKRWEYLVDEIRTHKAIEPCHTLKEENWEREYIKWLDKLVDLEVDAKMTWHEMEYHRTGTQQYSYGRGDMSEHHIAALPEWWFDGTRAKRKLRELNAK